MARPQLLPTFLLTLPHRGTLPSDTAVLLPYVNDVDND